MTFSYLTAKGLFSNMVSLNVAPVTSPVTVFDDGFSQTKAYMSPADKNRITITKRKMFVLSSMVQGMEISFTHPIAAAGLTVTALDGGVLRIYV